MWAQSLALLQWDDFNIHSLFHCILKLSYIIKRVDHKEVVIKRKSRESFRDFGFEGEIWVRFPTFEVPPCGEGESRESWGF